ncbi:MAG: protoglobin domain-containing protein [Candidatus Caldarchaeum sp.]|nr:protoglobin domain-containing protein [Candidatus Caldarchaeum sp.]MCX8200578.1 protoglobin domain-containing protein [Candidatus Caldarchaeum sp.]MDW8063341.1 protoglobin domain-containing protein [Candidatus Caldarchaeum sp.]MDW8434864.1 protoglobin domain-containing protein [Candidatus Caldarchaeum sp.]
MSKQIPGYTYGTKEAATSPVTEEDFNLLKTTVLMTDEDIKYLRLAGEVLKDQVNDVLDLWYGWVGSNKHLVHYFSHRKTGQPIQEYLEAVRKRFGQWILDTCFREYNRDWLNYQMEIGLRHHRTKKNKTDKVESVEHIPLRYLIAFIVPITATIKPFLAKKGHPPEEVEKMHNAWFKAVTLSVALWSIPYTGKGEW